MEHITVTRYADGPPGETWWEYLATDGDHEVRGWCRGTENDARRVARLGLRRCRQSAHGVTA